MSRLALTPTNVPALGSAPTTPTLRAGDLYYDTTTGLMVYTGTTWQAVSGSSLPDLDGGLPDSTAIYQGGEPNSVTFANTFNGGTP